MTELIKKLCLLNGTSGRENEVRDFIINEIKNFADSIEIDPLGNLLVMKKGKKRAKNRVMLDSHMDEVGFMITNINPDGTLNFECVGGISSAVMLGRHVSVGENKLPGVIGLVPIHLIPSDKRNDFPDRDSLSIDIGAQSKEEAEKLVHPGDCAYFDSEFVCFGDGYIKSKALDDRVGCAILINMIKTPQPYDLYYSFSVGEETGLGMAGTAVYNLKPDYAVVAETTTAADLCGVDEAKTVCRLGEGGAVSFMDRRTVYDKKLFDRAFEIGREKNIKLQAKTMVAGGNNAGIIHKSAGGVKTLTVSVPCRYLHSPSCVIKEEDVYSSMQLMSALAEDFANA